MVGIELLVEAAPVVKACLDRRLLVNCVQGTVVRLLPAMNLAEEQAHEACDILADVLKNQSGNNLPAQLNATVASESTEPVPQPAPDSMNDPICRIFGCRINAVTMDKAVKTIERWITAHDGTCRYVVTPNVHHAALLGQHEPLRRAYADAGLVLADGMPLVVAARLFHRRLPERVAGSDLVPALFEHYRGRPLRVYLLGAAEGVADRAAEKIRVRWPEVEVTGTLSPPLGFENDPAQNEAILHSVAAARPDVLVLGLGAPKQETWVHEHRGQLQVPATLCVGATIDFLAGNKRRAPRWMQRCGLEWLHRLATEPRRLAWRYLCDAGSLVVLLWREMWFHGLGAPGHDPLTALPDRRLFERRLDQALQQAARRDDYRFALCFIDLDGFKAVNDRFGHLTGDRTLCEVARRLVASARPGDTASRFGGDEFTVLLDDVRDSAEAEGMAATHPRLPGGAVGRRRPDGESLGEHGHRPQRQNPPTGQRHVASGRPGDVSRQVARRRPIGPVRRRLGPHYSWPVGVHGRVSDRNPKRKRG